MSRLDPAEDRALAHELTGGERLHRADELDLEPIVYKLTHPTPASRR
jgi:hypothetical protein